jgi:hypothetical protein
MATWVWILIAIAAVVVIGLAAWAFVQSRRSRQLRDTFGPEYDRTVADAPSKREAEAELRSREERHEEFDIRPLDQTSRDRYLRAWESTQARFVDDPHDAIIEADSLIQDVMRERGYPVENFDQRAADLSVDHADVVENYRGAHGIARQAGAGDADTEELRRAMVHYRSLFEALLETRQPAERTR